MGTKNKRTSERFRVVLASLSQSPREARRPWLEVPGYKWLDTWGLRNCTCPVRMGMPPSLSREAGRGAQQVPLRRKSSPVCLPETEMANYSAKQEPS